MPTKLWSANLKGKDNSEDFSVDGKIILKWFLQKEGREVWTGCTWLRIGISGGLL
jgi:hypothetical protein